LYAAVDLRLVDAGALYPDYLTPSELEQWRAAQSSGEGAGPPVVKRSVFAHSEDELARFADEDDHTTVLEFSRGDRSQRWITLELRCDECARALETTPGKETDSVSEKAPSPNASNAFDQRFACLAISTIAVLEAVALGVLVRDRFVRESSSADESTARYRLKRKTSDAPGPSVEARNSRVVVSEANKESKGILRVGARSRFDFDSVVVM
jgi:hypothetical protein